jgi:hypothetical protein
VPLALGFTHRKRWMDLHLIPYDLSAHAGSSQHPLFF